MYHFIDTPLQYWRSTSHFEVDFIIGNKLALEVKGTDLVTDKHLKGIRAFKEERFIVIWKKDTSVRFASFITRINNELINAIHGVKNMTAVILK